VRLQKSTELALCSVLEFASAPDRHVSAAQIADKYGVSTHHLAKVLAQLTRSGVVASVRGAGGGYRFTGNARRLTLRDIVEIFEELAPPSAADHDEPGACTPVERALSAVLSEIDTNAKATFGSITQATMLRLMERQTGGIRRGARKPGAVSTRHGSDRESP
jgi:Rrf2 family protein